LFGVGGSPTSLFLSVIGKEQQMTVEHLYELGWIKYTEGYIYPRSFTILDKYVVPFRNVPCMYAKIHPVIGELLEREVTLKKSDYIQVIPNLFHNGKIIGLNRVFNFMERMKYDALKYLHINLDDDFNYAYTMFCVYLNIIFMVSARTSLKPFPINTFQTILTRNSSIPSTL